MFVWKTCIYCEAEMTGPNREDINEIGNHPVCRKCRRGMTADEKAKFKHPEERQTVQKNGESRSRQK